MLNLERQWEQHKRLLPYLFLTLILGLWLADQWRDTPAVLAVERAIAGRVIDQQGEPVSRARVMLYLDDDAVPAIETQTQPDGSYLLSLPEELEFKSLRIRVERSHFATYEWTLDAIALEKLTEEGSLIVDDLTLVRRLQIGFWIVTGVFVGMLILIATEHIHKTLAALLAAAFILGISFVGGTFNPALEVFDFEQALAYVDFDVIFLLLGMMIVIGIIESTGIFQWMAYQAYRLSGGRGWLLATILMIITAVTSALLDNVTTMLLMTPITLQIAFAMDIDPFSLLLPEVLTSNIGGTATLIGTPVNILIGSYAGLSFNDFLTNLAPGTALSVVALIGFSLFYYRKEHRKAGSNISKTLVQRLEKNAQIEDPKKLLKAGIVFSVLLVLLVIGEWVHLPPAVSAIIGAVTMLIWVHPDIESMMAIVDWTTLMFFIGLFMVIGAVQEVGLIFLISNWLGGLVGDNLVVALLIVVWSAAILSGVVDNIPFAAAMLPVVRFLTNTIPGAGSNVLFYGLSIGADMGGNSTLIGASANLVTVGIAERAGYKVSFKRFLLVGFPAMIITVSVSLTWLLLRF